MKEKLILGIETSCDDTSIALLKGDPSDLSSPPVLLSHHSFSQEIILKKWGGVVPEIAARNHLDKLIPILETVLKESGINLSAIDLIGVTTHPGLLGPLLTGINCAKTISLLHSIPIVPVNHLYAHIEAIHLTTHLIVAQKSPLSYPYLALLVSGGHSIYFLVTAPSDFFILGNSIDDASGEAFDKGAKLLGLGYPGGKIIDDLALTGDEKKFPFPISLLNPKEANLSFSGVKTSLRNFLESHPDKDFKIEDVCASYQYAIVTALSIKLQSAMLLAFSKLNSNRPLPIVVGGGVACNSFLRKTLTEKFSNIHFVHPHFCTDNGAMIANYAFRTYFNNIPFPDCLLLDARGQFVSKKEKLNDQRKSK